MIFLEVTALHKIELDQTSLTLWAGTPKAGLYCLHGALPYQAIIGSAGLNPGCQSSWLVLIGMALYFLYIPRNLSN